MFQLTEEHLAVQQAARDFAQNELKPGVIERDTKAAYPTEQVRKMAELGFLGMMVSPEYGGGGMDTLSYVLAMEEISKIDNSCSKKNIPFKETTILGITWTLRKQYSSLTTLPPSSSKDNQLLSNPLYHLPKEK